MSPLTGGSAVKNPPASAGDMGLIRVTGRPPGEGNCNPLQYSCLENPKERSLAGSQRIGHDLSPQQQQIKIKMAREQ